MAAPSWSCGLHYDLHLGHRLAPPFRTSSKLTEDGPLASLSVPFVVLCFASQWSEKKGQAGEQETSPTGCRGTAMFLFFLAQDARDWVRNRIARTERKMASPTRAIGQEQCFPKGTINQARPFVCGWRVRKKRRGVRI